VRHRKGEKHKGLNKLGIICFMFIVAINFIGIGYSIWGSSVSVNEIISTGNIDTIVSNCIVDQNYSQLDNNNGATASTVINTDKKGFRILINGAYPEFSTRIKYTVTNRGSVPVKCRINDVSNAPIALSIVNPDGLVGYGESKDGYINLTVSTISHGEIIDLPIKLTFVQYNSSN
jgi:hypothetical protein